MNLKGDSVLSIQPVITFKATTDDVFFIDISADDICQLTYKMSLNCEK